MNLMLCTKTNQKNKVLLLVLIINKPLTLPLIHSLGINSKLIKTTILKLILNKKNINVVHKANIFHKLNLMYFLYNRFSLEANQSRKRN